MQQRDEQKIQIAELKGKIEVLEESLRDRPQDRNADLQRLQKEEQALNDDVAKKQNEVVALEARKLDAEKQFEEFRLRHTIRNK